MQGVAVNMPCIALSQAAKILCGNTSADDGVSVAELPSALFPMAMATEKRALERECGRPSANSCQGMQVVGRNGVGVLGALVAQAKAGTATNDPPRRVDVVDHAGQPR